ncbi:MAG TPA: methyltransferase domain-containing protein [Mycobacteriales bacterium]|nr:methyltransferase domain-containing protein [Mycobacteriales bacterium]
MERSCRGCGGGDVTTVLDLGRVPASDFFPRADDPQEDPAWPLRLVMCADCALVQLDVAEHPEPEAATAVESATALIHARESARAVIAAEGLKAGDRVIEIDSHHGGSWLGTFVGQGLIATDPSGTAELVVDVHGIAHEPDLRAPLAAHAGRLAPRGRLVLEFHHLLPLVEQSQIDTIRHGHWVYLSLISLGDLLRRQGLVVTRAESTPVFGGSLRVTARRASENPVIDAGVAAVVAAERAAGLDRPESIRALAEHGAKVAEQVRQHILAAHRSGRTITAYGAPSKAAVLLRLAGVDRSILPYTVDLAPAKHGCRIPGTGIPVEPIRELFVRRPDEIVILTWDIADEVVAQLARDKRRGDWNPEVFVPLPAPRYLSGFDSEG